MLNNPLGATDPTGYTAEDVGGTITYDPNGNPVMDWEDGTTDPILGSNIGSKNEVSDAVAVDLNISTPGSDVDGDGFPSPVPYTDPGGVGQLLDDVNQLKNFKRLGLGRALFNALLDKSRGIAFSHVPGESPDAAITLDMSVAGYVNEKMIEGAIEERRKDGRSIPDLDVLKSEVDVPVEVVVGHEIGHNLGLSEEAVIAFIENPMRRELGLEPRTTYQTKELDFSIITQRERQIWHDLIGQ